MGLGMVLHSMDPMKHWLYKVWENKKVDFNVVLIERNTVVWESKSSHPLDVIQRSLSCRDG
ncbi:hypothetical protein DVH24_009988 [Malus domestica]|uniref:Uncharacterized protein n=1 Tax=Malus domestica TaxID=3750 RepID=A0A498JUQ9_MALDO|nr:hypothetical protein DVH24_009988 [Malus domestica]